MSRIHTVKNIKGENILVKLVVIFKLVFTVFAHYVPTLLLVQRQVVGLQLRQTGAAAF